MPTVPLVILMRDAQSSHYKQMGLKMCGQYDRNMGLKEKMTGWGVVSSERCKKGISRSAAIRRGVGKNGGKLGK